MRRVLLLERDKKMADRLQRVLRAQGHSVSLVATMREACLALAQQPHDVAIIPLYESSSLVRSLRAIQPELPVLLTSREAAAAIPDDQAGLVQGLLPLAEMETVLPSLLARNGPGAEPVDQPTAEVETDPVGPAAPEIDRARLDELCRQPAIAHGLQLMLFSTGRQVLAHCGGLGQAEAQLVADRLNKTWSNGRHRVQLQYLQLPEFIEPMLLYTRPAVGCLLTLVALPGRRITDLRRQADSIVEQLVAHMVQATREARPLARAVPGVSPKTQWHSLVIAWRPVRPLPPPVQTVLTHHLRQLARNHSYELTYLQVEDDLIHLVVSCPRDCRSGAVARLFKEGTEKAIEQQFGLSASLWKKGYYAAESPEPMSRTDLNILL